MNKNTEHAKRECLKTDRQMLWIQLAHVPVVALLVPVGYGTHTFAITASVILGLLIAAAYASLKGTRGFSVVAGASLMAFSAIMIQAQMGRIEMHFHIFSAMALLIIYRDWLPIVAGAAVIAVHHLLLTGLQLGEASLAGMPVMIFNYGCSWSIAFLHAAFVVFEASILVFFAIRLNVERQITYSMVGLVEQFQASKNLSLRLDSHQDNTAVRAFNGMLEQFAGLVTQVGELSSRLKQNAASLSELSDQTSAILRDQHAQADQAAAATTEMTATIQDVARNAQQASEAASKATEAASHGQGRVDQAITLTESTNLSLEDSARAVQAVVDNVGSINAVITSINEISDQTNLLALNAAIEAARAGEHGRGFAVVADEVRNLSRRTQEFTDDIRSTIATLAKGSEKALAAIEMGKTRSTETTHAVRETGDSIAVVQQSISSVSDMNYQIASAAEEQATASADINESVHQVSSQNSRVVAEAGRASEMAGQLEQLVTEMDRLISGYRT